VDVLVEPSGALLVSDDHRGAVYRIRYAGPSATPTLARSTP
jgi:glucose/arabinose dehydrogenase